MESVNSRVNEDAFFSYFFFDRGFNVSDQGHYEYNKNNHMEKFSLIYCSNKKIKINCINHKREWTREIRKKMMVKKSQPIKLRNIKISLPAVQRSLKLDAKEDMNEIQVDQQAVAWCSND